MSGAGEAPKKPCAGEAVHNVTNVTPKPQGKIVQVIDVEGYWHDITEVQQAALMADGTPSSSFREKPADNVTNVTEQPAAPDNVTDVHIAEIADYAARKGVPYVTALQAVIERGLVELNWSNPNYTTSPTLMQRIAQAFGLKWGAP